MRLSWAILVRCRSMLGSVHPCTQVGNEEACLLSVGRQVAPLDGLHGQTRKASHLLRRCSLTGVEEGGEALLV